jgi:hypothetical protein
MTTTTEATTDTDMINRLPPSCCHYLVIGGGATGLAFADTLLKSYYSDSSPAAEAEQQEQPPALTVVMVDKHLQPGGQWNDMWYAMVESKRFEVTMEIWCLSMEPPCRSLGHHHWTRPCLCIAARARSITQSIMPKVLLRPCWKLCLK